MDSNGAVEDGSAYPATESLDGELVFQSWRETLSIAFLVQYDFTVNIDARDIAPTVSWGTSPQDVLPISGMVPFPKNFSSDADRETSCIRALDYTGLTSSTPLQDIQVDKAFIGSCTNSRIEDLRDAARILAGRKIAPNIKRAIVVPGSGLVKRQAEHEGLDEIFLAAGFEWREPGCSLCVGMNSDVVLAYERVASSSNRNFEGRQGDLARTHLMSPPTVAAAAIAGRLADVRDFSQLNLVPRHSRAAVVIQSETTHLGLDENRLEGISAPNIGPSQDLANNQTHNETGSIPRFTTWKGIAAHMTRPNIDTDLILPTEFCKTIKKAGLGGAAFYPLRYDLQDGSERPDFILNQGIYRQSKILVVTGHNFGCGSSREHAPWALKDFGIRCIIAPSFANIFFNNAFKNSVLPIVIQDATVLEAIAAEARAGHEIVTLSASSSRRSLEWFSDISMLIPSRSIV